jgi:hypothetical protein
MRGFLFVIILLVMNVGSVFAEVGGDLTKTSEFSVDGLKIENGVSSKMEQGLSIASIDTNASQEPVKKFDLFGLNAFRFGLVVGFVSPLIGAGLSFIFIPLILILPEVVGVAFSSAAIKAVKKSTKNDKPQKRKAIWGAIVGGLTSLVLIAGALTVLFVAASGY